MANIGQIVYNLQDYANSGGLISTDKDNRSSTISSIDADYLTKRIDITQNVVTGSGYTKVGIQAPAGTRAILNTNKTILIGRTGIYELDEDITITSLYFIKPKNYIIDEEATNEAIKEGKEGLAAAEAYRVEKLAALKTQLDNKEITEDVYWIRYSEIQEDYDEMYAAALNQFNSGINGIYKLNSAEPEADLFNVIIDFIQ